MRRENDNTFYKKVVALATKILHHEKIFKKIKKSVDTTFQLWQNKKCPRKQRDKKAH